MTSPRRARVDTVADYAILSEKKANESSLQVDMHNKRHDDILKLLHLRKQVSVSELTKRLGVSEVTIRKDLAILEDQGHLVRVRGGAIPAENAEESRSLYVRQSENVPAKRVVAERARELVHEGDTIFLDSGSSCAALARVLGGATYG